MPSCSSLPDFLPGRLTLERGCARDYAALGQFHYLAKRPATWAGVWVIRYSDHRAIPPLPAREEGRGEGRELELRERHVSDAFTPHPDPLSSRGEGVHARVIAVGVLSYPVPSCKSRERFFGLQSNTRRENLGFVNQNLRTISRVIVHPQFRSLGLASILVRCLCENCPTRYVEALAVMGRVHPFFEKAGMTRIEPKQRDEPVYFIFDRNREIASSEQTHNESQAGP